MENKKTFLINQQNRDFKLSMTIDDMREVVDYYHTYYIYKYISENYSFYDGENEIVNEDLDELASDLYEWAYSEYDKVHVDENILIDFCDQVGYRFEEKKYIDKSEVILNKVDGLLSEKPEPNITISENNKGKEM